MYLDALDPRRRSLLRSTILVLGALFLAFRLDGFPNARPSLELFIPLVMAALGIWDTARCLRHSWSFYHAAVLVFLFMDIMALAMILFLFLYPFGQWLQ